MSDMPSTLKRKLPAPAMLAVGQFCELVPGIACSSLVLGDLIEVLKTQGSISSETGFGDPPVLGLFSENHSRAWGGGGTPVGRLLPRLLHSR